MNNRATIIFFVIPKWFQILNAFVSTIIALCRLTQMLVRVGLTFISANMHDLYTGNYQDQHTKDTP